MKENTKEDREAVDESLKTECYDKNLKVEDEMEGVSVNFLEGTIYIDTDGRLDMIYNTKKGGRKRITEKYRTYTDHGYQRNRKAVLITLLHSVADFTVQTTKKMYAKSFTDTLNTHAL